MNESINFNHEKGGGMPKIHVAAMLEPDEYDTLKKLAQIDQRPVSAFVRLIIKDRLELVLKRNQKCTRSAQK